MSSINPAGPNQVDMSETKEPVIKKPRKSPGKITSEHEDLLLPGVIHPMNTQTQEFLGSRKKITPLKTPAKQRTDQVAKRVIKQVKLPDEPVKAESKLKSALKNPIPKPQPPAEVITITDIPADPKEQEFLTCLALPGGGDDLFTVSHYAAYLADQGRYEEADKYFKLALAHTGSQNDIFTLSRYALLLKNRGQLAQARVECKKAILLPEALEDVFTLNCYAAILRKLKEYEKSLRFFRAALSYQESRRNPSIFKEFVATVQEYVLTLKEQEKYDEAEAVVLKALEQPSRHHPALFREYGFILNWQGKFDEGRKQYAKAAELEKVSK